MRPRHAARLDARVLCRLPYSDWLALPRGERKRRLQAAKKGARRG
jgi:hypothetical protein